MSHGLETYGGMYEPHAAEGSRHDARTARSGAPSPSSEGANWSGPAGAGRGPVEVGAQRLVAEPHEHDARSR
jgi:hypothetical protein